MKEKRTPFYTFARGVIWVTLKLLCRVRIEGAENYPKDTNFIVLGNHTSAMDPFAMALSCRDWEIHFLAKDTLLKNPLMRLLLPPLHIIPVRRDGGSNMAMMRQAMDVLRQGHVLGVFPEGHRNHTGSMEKLETGIAVLALKSRQPIVPVYINGAYGFWKGLRVQVGKPIPMEDLRATAPDTVTMDAVKARIVETIGQLAAAEHKRLSDGQEKKK